MAIMAWCGRNRLWLVSEAEGLRKRAANCDTVVLAELSNVQHYSAPSDPRT
jgi:hypothetical protein